MRSSSRTLNRRPTARYQSADELKQAIESIFVLRTGCNARRDARFKSNRRGSNRKETVGQRMRPLRVRGLGWICEVKGTIQANQDGLQLEYYVCDSIWGKLRSSLRTIEIPWSRIVKVDFSKRDVFQW